MSAQLQVTGEAKIRDIQGPVVANSGVVTALDGAASQYVRGDGTLADFPTSSGGGSSVSYYLNSSVSQGTIGGVAYRELSKEPIIGAGTDIAIAANGYVANYLTDVNDPDVILVPGGNFNCEFYFSVSNDTGNPTTYAELYKYDGTTFTLLGTSAGVPESINQGTTIAPYYFAIPVATAALSVTDRLAIRIYVNVDGRTVTLHTENGHLCQVVTTLSKGMVSLNNLTDQSQYLATGTSGTDFNIVSSGDTHTFNIPSASASNRGLITTGSQTIGGQKTFNDFTRFNLTVTFDEPAFFQYNTLHKYNLLTGAASGSIATYARQSGTISGFQYQFDNTKSTILNFNNANDYTYTFPALSGTLALLEGTQTFSGAKTFSLDITVNSVKVGEGGGSISGNTILGTGSLNANTTGFENSALGYATLNLNTTGYNNTAIGYAALNSNTTGSYNLGIGSRSLFTNTTGANNSALGNNSLRLNTTGDNNTAIGVNALQNNTTASFNTAIGNNSLNGNTTGTYNTAIGSESLIGNTTGINNTAIGYATLGNGTTASNNVAIGYGSGVNISTGSNNTLITGGSAITTGSNNTIIGNYAGTTTLANNIVLADGAGNVRYRYDGTNNNLYGNVNFSSTIGNGTYTYTLPSATGTLALTSNLSAYLPLAGGTLTGALSGTSATFSGNLNVGTNIAQLLPITTTNFQILTGCFYDGSNIIATATSGTRIISNAGSFTFNNFTGATIGSSVSDTARLTIASTGAATFSSSVTSSGYFASDTYRDSRLQKLLGYEGSNQIRMGSGDASDYLTFFTGATERMRITSGGNITTTNPASGLDSLIINSTANPYTSSTITSLTTQSGNSTSWFFYGIAGGASKAYLQTDGNWRIASGSTYGNISDAKMKTNIVDATPKLDDILKIKVRNFGTIDNPNEKYIGFIAQEFEEVFPKLVFQNEDIEYTDNGRVTLGTFTKGIKESALIPILVKAIQEQQAQIEELKALIAAK